MNTFEEELEEEQCAFRKGRICTDATFTVQHIVLKKENIISNTFGKCYTPVHLQIECTRRLLNTLLYFQQ